MLKLTSEMLNIGCAKDFRSDFEIAKNDFNCDFKMRCPKRFWELIPQQSPHEFNHDLNDISIKNVFELNISKNVLLFNT